MKPIIARWEWRAFGSSFGPAEPLLAKMVAEKVQHSEETYLISANSDANVKVRDELLDIKLRERVDDNGLEQWRPVLKSPFPLDSDAVATLHKAWGVNELPSPSHGLSLDELLALGSTSSGPIRVVPVCKTRSRFHIQGCVAERSEVIAAGTRILTVAIEDEDPERVLAAVKSMALEGLPNTSYPRGLKQLLGLFHGEAHPKRRAVIDVGTNSVKFLVADLGPDGVWVPVVDRAIVSRLGGGMENTGSISPAASERTADAIADMAAEAARLGVQDVAAVGTMGLRTASNRQEFLDLVQGRCDVIIKVIGGEDESRIAYLAVQSALGLADADLVVFDTGGGSTQFTIGHGARVDRRFSLNVGAIRLTEQFQLDQVVSDVTLTRALAAIGGELSAIDSVSSPQAIVGMGGAVTNLTAVMLGMKTYDPDRVQGALLERSEIDRQIELYRSMTAASRRQIIGLQPSRAEVILAGACIVRTIMEKFGKDSLSVSDRGLRHGVLIERFGGRLAGPGSH